MFADSWYVENVLLAIFAIGGVIGLMIRSGALRGVLEALTARTESPADAEKAAFLAGIIIHIDDYFNCLVVGSMMRPLTDKYNVSRAKLAYYVDSAGSPAARLAFYSTWGAALIGFIGKALVTAQKQDKLPDGMSQYVAGHGDKAHAVTNQIWPLFFNSIIFGFYSWTALIVAGLVAWQVVPNIMGMGDEESRARNGGGVVGDDHDPMISARWTSTRCRDRNARLAQLRHSHRDDDRRRPERDVLAGESGPLRPAHEHPVSLSAGITSSFPPVESGRSTSAAFDSDSRPSRRSSSRSSSTASRATSRATRTRRRR